MLIMAPSPKQLSFQVTTFHHLRGEALPFPQTRPGTLIEELTASRRALSATPHVQLHVRVCPPARGTDRKPHRGGDVPLSLDLFRPNTQHDCLAFSESLLKE